MGNDYISRDAALGIRVTVTIQGGISKKVKDSVHRSIETAFRDFFNQIEEIPAAEVEEVVHCKDCIHWNGRDCTTIKGLAYPGPNDYCSRGEQIDNGDETS